MQGRRVWANLITGGIRFELQDIPSGTDINDDTGSEKSARTAVIRLKVRFVYT